MRAGEPVGHRNRSEPTDITNEKETRTTQHKADPCKRIVLSVSSTPVPAPGAPRRPANSRTMRASEAAATHTRDKMIIHTHTTHDALCVREKCAYRFTVQTTLMKRIQMHTRKQDLWQMPT